MVAGHRAPIASQAAPRSRPHALPFAAGSVVADWLPPPSSMVPEVLLWILSHPPLEHGRVGSDNRIDVPLAVARVHDLNGLHDCAIPAQTAA